MRVVLQHCRLGLHTRVLAYVHYNHWSVVPSWASLGAHMNISACKHEHDLVSLSKYLLINGLLAALIGVVAGLGCWVFMFGLELIGHWREQQGFLPWLALPPVGVLVVWLYQRWGQDVLGGNNLLLEQIHAPKQRTPLRMAILILFSTWLGHLSGASVGREGSGVQIGGTLADNLAALLRVGAARRRLLLIAGISASFAALFGTPMAAALFAVEVLMIGGLGYAAIFPALVAAITAHMLCQSLGLQHGHYQQRSQLLFDVPTALRVMLLAGCCALVARCFSFLMRLFTRYSLKWLKNAYWRAAFAGVVMCAALWLFGAKYAGLGEETIRQSFVQVQGVEVFALKMLLTAFCLALGFKGGEVTPLFFTGATLGSALAWYVGLPLDVAAAIGFVGVFCAASNTPLACTVLAVELFGHENALFFMLACVVSYVMAGHSSIYRAQLRGRKLELQLPC